MVEQYAERPVWTTPQILAGIVGAIYLVMGIIGFSITGLGDFAEHTDDELIGFGINPLHNVFHVATGVLGIGMAPRVASARIFGWLLTVAYAAVFVYGLWAVDEPDGDFLGINSADNWLHAITAILGLLIALVTVRRVARIRAQI